MRRLLARAKSRLSHLEDGEASAEWLMVSALGIDPPCRARLKTLLRVEGDQEQHSVSTNASASASAAAAAAHPSRISGDGGDRAAARRFLRQVRRRAGREPLQYILGEWDFHDVTVVVRAPILIPRPETELLVDIALAHATRAGAGAAKAGAGARVEPRTRGRGGESAVTARRLSFLDVGAGTGCIGLSLLKAVPSATCWAIDPNPAAVSLSLENAARLGLAERYTCVESTLQDFSPHTPSPSASPSALSPPPSSTATSTVKSKSSTVKSKSTSSAKSESTATSASSTASSTASSSSSSSSSPLFDVIVANPPYITREAMARLEPEVVGWEDDGALCGGEDGLDVVRDILDAAPHLLRRGGMLVMEVGFDQTSTVVQEYKKRAEARAAGGPAAGAAVAGAAVEGAADGVAEAAEVMVVEPHKVEPHKVEVHKDLFGHDRFVSAVYL